MILEKVSLVIHPVCKWLIHSSRCFSEIAGLQAFCKVARVVIKVLTRQGRLRLVTGSLTTCVGPVPFSNAVGVT